MWWDPSEESVTSAFLLSVRWRVQCHGGDSDDLDELAGTRPRDACRPAATGFWPRLSSRIVGVQFLFDSIEVRLLCYHPRRRSHNL